MAKPQIGCRLMTAVRALAIVIGVLAFGARASTLRAVEEPIEYNRDVQPILMENCFTCHGPDSASRKGDLRLDQRETALEMAAIVPEKPNESEVIRRVLSVDADEQMPPPGSHKSLTGEQKALLQRWIAEGAQYQPHWSFIAPRRPEAPTVNSPGFRICNPIDAFVSVRLHREGLTMEPEADRRTLARRLSLDLTGLPPTPEMIEAFLKDTSSAAYELLVDQLLDSPHWGEHRARYWLDTARYADTHGFHFDNYREMWTYRDWVIDAFNRNQPFDQFTVEQLAGDLLTDATLDQQIATGFNRCNMTSSEGGIIDQEYLVHYTRDRTETAAQTWLGLTVGCAVCHDHKFDPLTQREFYAMSAIFNNAKQAAKDGNIKDTAPVVFVPLPKDRARWKSLPTELAVVRKRIAQVEPEVRAEFDPWAQSVTPADIPVTAPHEDLLLHVPLTEESEGALDVTVDGKLQSIAASHLAWESGQIAPKALKVTADLSIELYAGNFERNQSFSCGVWIKFPKSSTTGAILARMEEHNLRGWDLWVQGNRIGMHLVHQWPDDALNVVTKTQLKPDEWHHVLVTYDGSSKPEGIDIYYDGQLQPVDAQPEVISGTVRTNAPLKIGQRASESRICDIALQDIRLYGRLVTTDEIYNLAKETRTSMLVAKPANERTRIENDELFEWWFDNINPVTTALRSDERRLQREQRTIEHRGAVAHIMQELHAPAVASLLERGAYDRPIAEVRPDTPSFLPPMSDDLPRNRLGFARWLLRPENPLTARVIVNRFWQEVFGTGIVRTTGDFGVAGELPANQALLDWLAVEFQESNWDVKRFFKLLVTSATYRQSASTTPAKLEKDPQNRLLSRGPRFRMDAEMIRDFALASSGLLTPRLGGPSVKPYQPEGVWETVAMIGSNTRQYEQGTGDSLYRRSLYTFWKRSAPPPSMETFNASSREVCVVRRERTNTPLQALVTLNDPQFIESARQLAQTVLLEDHNNDVRLRKLGERLVGRPWHDYELSIIRSSLNDLTRYYADNVKHANALIRVGESQANLILDPSLLAAWTMLANELMNLDEVLNK